jgi:hypothetical protein
MARIFAAVTAFALALTAVTLAQSLGLVKAADKALDRVI